MLSISDGSCESLNSVQNFMDILENVADEWIFKWMDGRIEWSPQASMQNGSIFGEIDMVLNDDKNLLH